MASSTSWKKIFDDYDILNHNFNVGHYVLKAEQIKKSCQNFKKTTEKEVRILCKQDSREDRPDIFKKNDLFLLPVKNGEYAIIKGEGYVDVPEIKTTIKNYKSKLDFKLESSLIGNSEMQHLDFAYASSLIRTFIGDDSLVLTIRGRKYTPQFSFRVGSQTINVESVQTEVDAGYEGRNKIILVEAKNSSTKNTIIRQLFYPFKQWKTQTTKDILLIFFEKQGAAYNIWQYAFVDENDYNSIVLVKSSRYEII
jgi:hypothetical protein